MKYILINDDCMECLEHSEKRWDTIFADPPDNISQKYPGNHDRLPDKEYIRLLSRWLNSFATIAQTIWFSYNTKWSFAIGRIIQDILDAQPSLLAKECVQTFTFGQHNQHDLANNHRPILRLRWKNAPLFPDAIRVPSWRQLHGDSRADPRGRVPGDVFDFPRVTGNSKQRRSWHPTQLHEGLVERCLKLTTPEGGNVLDPFAGTGTVMRVCKKVGFNCTSIEKEKLYCSMIAAEHKMEIY